MSLPSVTDYHDAVQDPARAFSDGDLKSGILKTNALGLPEMAGGGLAVTYQVNSAGRRFAVRCFHREAPGLGERYSKISSALKGLSSPYFVNFDYQAAGVLVRGLRHPIVKMDWVEGETLDVYLTGHAREPSRMIALRDRFSKLERFLSAQGAAHGDLQNLNVIVQNGELRLIDYDGMYVPGMTLGRGTEVGHKAFQHPMRSPADFGPDMDRFSFIVLDLSLEAVSRRAELHQRYNNGGESIIFRANDYADPQSSSVFSELRSIPDLKDAADRLAAICLAPPSQTPTLADFLAGRNIPAGPPASVATGIAKSSIGYIGAYPVLPGGDYGGVERRVGERIEIVGQITSVKEGVGRRGRGRGLPHVFINFGKWNEQSVKVTLWSEGLKQVSDRPSEAWVGRWISVTGLVEPPYHGSFRGRPYSSVGVTVTSDGQILQLSEKEARFRLGAVGAIGDVNRQSASSRGVKSNADLLNQLGSTGARSRQAKVQTSRPSAPPQPVTSNQQLLAALKTQQSSSGAASVRASRPTPSLAPSASPPVKKSADYGWVWGLIILGVVVFLLGKCGG